MSGSLLSTGRAPARVGLLGNPSDLYQGVVLGFALANFQALVEARQGTGGEVEAEGPASELLLAAWQRLKDRGIRAPAGGLVLSCQTTIPRQVGLSGSSALVLAALRALLEACGAHLSPFDLAEETLAAETQTLGLIAGPQDRVLQAHGGLLLMDFRGERKPSSYTRLDPALLPDLLLAYDPLPGEASSSAHAEVRRRFFSGDPTVQRAMAHFGELALAGKEALEHGDQAHLADLMDQNFDLRRTLFALSPETAAPVEWARAAGAAAKFCGSGGAVICLPRRGSSREDLGQAFLAHGWCVADPRIEPPVGGDPRS